MKRVLTAALLCLLEVVWITAGSHTSIHAHGEEESAHSHNSVFDSNHEHVDFRHDRDTSQFSSQDLNTVAERELELWQSHGSTRHFVASSPNRLARVERDLQFSWTPGVTKHQFNLEFHSNLYLSTLTLSQLRIPGLTHQLELHSTQMLKIVMRC